MNRRSVFLSIGQCAALLAVGGCTPKKTIEALKKMGEIAYDPDMKIGPLSQQPSTMTAIIYSTTGANKTALGDAPVDVWVFELSGDDLFSSSDYLTLTEDPKAALKQTYIKHQSKQVTAGNSEVLPVISLDKDTRFLGVAVGFANNDKARWRSVEKVNPIGENYTIFVPINTGSVSIQVHR